jgi:phenylalanyl-tRNA synthetase beta chain
MKISLHWLQTLLPLQASAVDIAEKLTVHTAEVEEIIELAPFYDHVVAAKLVGTKKMENSDKLTIGEWDCGDRGLKQILFGMVHPLEIGCVYPVAIDGATMMSGIKIKNKTIAGEKSEGMVCDNAELGMKNTRMMELPADTKLGASLAEIFPECRDTLIDIDNKSLTHRPDLMGHIGFAREFAALYGIDFDLEIFEMPQTDGASIGVKIETDLCSRFMAVKVADISTTAWPIGTQLMLEHLGVRSISPIVDVTNQILLLRGQPMHAFDADAVTGDLVIRQAKKGEKLKALDAEEYELNTDDIVVADANGVLSVAGVMGGFESGVTDKTQNIIFECAMFDATAVRKTSAKLGLRSESSMRYEKSLDPEGTEQAVYQAMTLATDATTAVLGAVTDVYPGRVESLVITLDPEHVRRVLGIAIADNEIVAILESLKFGVTQQDTTLNVTIPSFRATKDIGIPEDLIEEIVRIYGYDAIEGSMPALPIVPPIANKLRAMQWKMADFCAQRGYFEVQHYSFVNADGMDFTEMENYVVLENPLSAHHSHMRRRLMTNMVKHINTELNENSEKWVCEFGRVFEAQNNTTPNQPWHFAMCGASKNMDEKDVLKKMRTDFDTLMMKLGVGYSVKQSAAMAPAFLHPNKAGTIVVAGQPVGYLGMLHPVKNQKKDATVCCLEIDLEAILAAAENHAAYESKEIHRATRDISFVLGARVPTWDMIETVVHTDTNVHTAAIFDVFEDANVFGAEKKSVGIRVTFLDENTVTAQSMEAIELAVCEKFDAVLHKNFTQ